jgi:hypothetical protein
MGHVTIFCDDLYVFELDKDVQARLELLNCDVVFDMKISELQFIFPDDSVVVFDFTEDLVVGEVPLSLEIDNEYKNNVLDYYQEQIDTLSSSINTDVFLYGEGYYQNIIIRIFNKYIVFDGILVDDDEDFDDPDPHDPHDPDDGEKIPDGDFCFGKKSKKSFSISSFVILEIPYFL